MTDLSAGLKHLLQWLGVITQERSMRATLLGIAVCTIAELAIAQAGDYLPNKLSGRWTFISPSQTFVNPVTLEFDGDGKPGLITDARHTAESVAAQRTSR